MSSETKMTWHLTFHARVEELGRKIESLRERAVRRFPGLRSQGAQEFAAIEARHADLQHTISNLQARSHEPRREVIDALEADYEGLVQSINRWMARQDTKASQH